MSYTWSVISLCVCVKEVCRCVCVCELTSPPSECNELPWASLTFTPPSHASVAPSLLLLFPKLGPINPSLPPACLFKQGMVGSKGESTACTHVFLYISRAKDFRMVRMSWSYFDYHVLGSSRCLCLSAGNKKTRRQQLRCRVSSFTPWTDPVAMIR